MKKKALKKEELFTAKDVGRYLGALSEEYQARVQALAEITLGLDKKMERGFGEMRTTLQSHAEMIGGLATDMAIVKDNIEIIKNGLKKKTDYDEFALLEHRVSVLETLVRR
jgi:ppGpp synthetase/RelA/SpoT-type nucleotidyltranferase